MVKFVDLLAGEAPEPVTPDIFYPNDRIVAFGDSGTFIGHDGPNYGIVAFDNGITHTVPLDRMRINHA